MKIKHLLFTIIVLTFATLTSLYSIHAQENVDFKETRVTSTPISDPVTTQVSYPTQTQVNSNLIIVFVISIALLSTILMLILVLTRKKPKKENAEPIKFHEDPPEEAVGKETHGKKI